MSLVESGVENSLVVEKGHSGELLFIDSRGVHLQTDTASTSFWLHVDGDMVLIERQSQDARPSRSQPLPLGVLSPYISWWEERGTGRFLASFQAMVQRRVEGYALEINNMGLLPIRVVLPKTAAKVQERVAPPGIESAKTLLLRCWPFLTQEQIDSFSKELQPEHYKPSEIVIGEGDSAEPPADRMFFVAQGTVDVIQNNVQVASINAQSPAPYFGEVALVNKAPRNATVRAHGDVDVFSFDGDSLLRLEQSSPRAKKLIDLVIRIRDGQPISPLDLANAINLAPEIHPAFSHWLNYLSQFLNQPGSSEQYLQEARDAGQLSAAAENLMIACGYLIQESLAQGNPAEVISRVEGLIEQAAQNCERAGKLHDIRTLRAINARGNLDNIVTLLTVEAVAKIS